MSRSIRMFSTALILIVGNGFLLCAQASSQTEPSDLTATASSPVAYVYVSRRVNRTNLVIQGYAAASNGSLAAIPGSPFPYNVNAIATSGSWLFGVESGTSSASGQLINSFAIAGNGALALKHQTYVNDTGGGIINLFLDRTESSLYVDYYTTNDDYLSYSIDQANGGLTYLGILHGGPENDTVMSFIASNEYAYSSNCYHFSPDIFGVKRAANGDLTGLRLNAPYPTPPPGTAYCPFLAASDSANHLAIAVQPFPCYACAPTGPYQLATYTVDSAGNLATTSTYKNMPSVSVGNITDYSMSPSGKFLAVGGTSGFEIFHFNGANPITKYTGPLTKVEVDQMFWDNANHVYAISQTAGKLYVFTVTSTGVIQAPGSPHSIQNPWSIVVLPKT